MCVYACANSCLYPAMPQSLYQEGGVGFVESIDYNNQAINCQLTTALKDLFAFDCTWSRYLAAVTVNTEIILFVK